MPTTQDTFNLGGGLDLVSDYLSIKPGRCTDVLNYQPGLNNGYDRIKGFEVFDGRPWPHSQNYTAFEVDTPENIAIGDAVTGGTSAATGTVIAKSGSHIGVTKVTGTFQVDESLLVGGLPVATITNYLGRGLGPIALDPVWELAAQDLYRADIEQVPGEGPIRGVHVYRHVAIAFRDNVGATKTSMYFSTSGGWTELEFDYVVRFNGNGTGNAQIQIGDTITGVTSGHSAPVLNVIKLTGSWGVDATGYLVLDRAFFTVSNFTAGEEVRVAGVKVADLDGACEQFTFPPGGEFHCINHNFYSTDTGEMMYGVNGVGPAFELSFDSILTPILYDETNVSAPERNTPHLICAHKNHLVLAFENGLINHSVQGAPTLFDGFLGAAEFGLGAPVTYIGSDAGDVMLMATTRSTYGLYGNNIDDWKKSVIAPDVGIKPGTGQMLFSLIGMDDRGLVSNPRSDTYGNFSSTTISQLINPLIQEYRTRAIGSVLVRDRSQYRLFFDDGTFLIAYVKSSPRAPGGVKFEYTIGNYGIVPTAFTNGELEGGMEVVLFGDADGWVYRAEVGKNFNGAEIEGWLRLPFNHSRNPRVRKRYRRAVVDLQASTPVTLRVSAELQYGSPNKLNPRLARSTTPGGGDSYWGSGVWGEMVWGAQTLSNVYYSLTGTGVNISLTFYTKSATTGEHTLNSVQIDYDPRRRERNA